MSLFLPVDARTVALTRCLCIPSWHLRASQGRYGADARQNAGS